MIRLIVALFLSVPLLAADPVSRKDLKPGLVARFDERGHVGSIKAVRLEPAIAFSMNPGESMHPGMERTWAAIWSGYIQIVTTGEYTFSANLVGAGIVVTLRREGKEIQLLDDSKQVGNVEFIRGDPIKLEADFYEIDVFMVRDKGPNNTELPCRFELFWEGPGFVREPIPYFFFGHLPKQRDFIERRHDQDHGRYLFEELACAKCHQGEKPLADRTGPVLSAVGSRVYAGWLDAWLADPAKLRPHTVMPKMFDDSNAGHAERYAVVQFLSSLGGPLKVEPLKFYSEFFRSADSGRKLFTTTGCAACHGAKLPGTMKSNVDDDPPPPFDPRDSFYGLGGNPQAVYALGGLGSKTSAEELAKYLKDPLKTNPHGRMPRMGLSSQEALDLARHLIRETDDAVPGRVATPKWDAGRLAEDYLNDKEFQDLSEMKPAEQWREMGQRVFVAKGCVNCHSLTVNGKALTANNTFANRNAIRSASNKGCLADKPKSIVYSLDNTQRIALREYVKSGATVSKSPIYETKAALKRFNCLNCHSMHGEGGLGSELADAMKKLEMAQNVDDVLPPRLTGIGRKATQAWLKDVLENGQRARPWMGLRMPQYGSANIGHLPAGFAACEGVGPEISTKQKVNPELLEAGRKLAGKEGLGCVACHDMAGFAGGGTRGPDLAQTAKRVREEWFTRWMHNPQRLMPGTRMPTNFTDGRSVSPLLNSSGDAQTAALWAYLSLGPGLPLPSGIEPPGKGIPIIVKDRVELLRTFMPDGAGTKAIAVGFPGGASYAFDAHACRVAYAWEGNFLDAAPVWASRGGNEAKLLGPKYFTPPAGQPWYLGESPDYLKRAKDFAFGAAVPFEKIFTGPMRVHFDGYSLDDAGQPSFRYRIEDEIGAASVSVVDAPRPLKENLTAGLHRKFDIDASSLRGRGLWFLAANTTQLPRLRVPNGTVLGLDIRYGLPVESGLLVLPQPDGKAITIDVSQAPKGAMWEFLPTDGKTWQAVLRIPAFRTEAKLELDFTLRVLPRDDDALLTAIQAPKP